MAFDGLVMANICYELKTSLVNGRIAKIAMPNKDELLISIKNNSKTFRLLISANASLPLIYLSDVNKQSPIQAPAFCMFLRKYIGSAKILDIYMDSLERIITIELEHNDELGDKSRKKIIFEMMGKHSNIIFTDNEFKILDSIKRINASTSSLREVLPGRRYFLPEELRKINPLELNLIQFTSLLKESKENVLRFLYLNFAGLSPLLADELCTRANIGSERLASSLSEIEITHLFRTFELLIEDIKENRFLPNIIYKDDEPIEFSSTKLSSYDNSNFKVVHFDNISKLLFEYYSTKDTYIRIKQKSADLRKIVSTIMERNTKKFDLQKKQLLDTDKMDKFKIYGDLLTTYGYELKGGEKEIICLNYYSDNKEIKIPLDDTLSAIENAKKYYDKYAKLKRTKDALSDQIEKTASDIEHLESILTGLDLASGEDDLAQIKEELSEYSYIKRSPSTKKNKLVSKPLHFISSDGFDIFVGKNNFQNEELSFKIASGNDWWFHAKNSPGSHVIVKSENKELSDKCFEEAAALAAYYSANRLSPKVEVDYIQKKNLKKVPNAAPGFVIYHSNWSMNVSPSNKLEQII